MDMRQARRFRWTFQMLDHNLVVVLSIIIARTSNALGARSEKAREMHQHNVFYTNYNTTVSLT